jgi:DNA-binding phage protein
MCRRRCSAKLSWSWTTCFARTDSGGGQTRGEPLDNTVQVIYHAGYVPRTAIVTTLPVKKKRHFQLRPLEANQRRDQDPRLNERLATRLADPSRAHEFDAAARHSGEREEAFLRENPLEAARVLAKQLVLALARQRVLHERSQEYVARWLQTRQPAIARLERAISDPKLSTVVAYASALGLKLRLVDREGRIHADDEVDWAERFDLNAVEPTPIPAVTTANTSG